MDRGNRREIPCRRRRSAPKTAGRLDTVVRKAMVWEIWNSSTREMLWIIREGGGCALRVDPDVLGLQGFYPIPKPIYAVVTTDTMIPKAFYDLYAHLAADLDDTSRRISDLTAKIKVRGGYNAANKDIANLLTADDGKTAACRWRRSYVGRTCKITFGWCRFWNGSTR